MSALKFQLFNYYIVKMHLKDIFQWLYIYYTSNSCVFVGHMILTPRESGCLKRCNQWECHPLNMYPRWCTMQLWTSLYYSMPLHDDHSKGQTRPKTLSAIHKTHCNSVFGQVSRNPLLDHNTSLFSSYLFHHSNCCSSWNASKKLDPVS